MPEKQKSSHNWKNPKTIIAAVSVTGLLTLWNTFATHDRQKTGSWEPIDSTSTVTPTPATDDACPKPDPATNLGTKCITVTATRSS